jgi:hypothetical protein
LVFGEQTTIPEKFAGRCSFAQIFVREIEDGGYFSGSD